MGKFILPSREKQEEAIAAIKQDLTLAGEFMRKHQNFPESIKYSFQEFLLKYGQPFYMNDKTFAGKRMKQKECFSNAGDVALYNDDLTYVEGKLCTFGLNIDHAWLADKDGNVIDPTIRPHDGILGYFGVPFTQEYLRKTVLKHEMWGVLGYWNLPELLKDIEPKLFLKEAA